MALWLCISLAGGSRLVRFCHLCHENVSCHMLVDFWWGQCACVLWFVISENVTDV